MISLLYLAINGRVFLLKYFGILFSVNKATGERMGRVESPGLGMDGMMSYMHDGIQRIVLQTPGQLAAFSLPTEED